MSIPVTEKRKKNNLQITKLTDYFVTSSIGKKHMVNISEHEIKMRSQYFEIIDIIVMEMNRRFKQAELIEAVEACNPSSKMFLDFDTLIKLASGVKCPMLVTDQNRNKKPSKRPSVAASRLSRIYENIPIVHYCIIARNWLSPKTRFGRSNILPHWDGRHHHLHYLICTLIIYIHHYKSHILVFLFFIFKKFSWHLVI